MVNIILKKYAFSPLLAARHQAALLEEEPDVDNEQDEENAPEAQKIEFPDDKMGAKVQIDLKILKSCSKTHVRLKNMLNYGVTS